MIRGEKVLAIIPARGGSKGLPGKNIRDLAGKPLIAWSIEAGLASRCIDRLVLSSDDESIIEVARQHGCDVPFRREAHLATDEATTVDVVLDALQRCPGYDWVVVLQPTSPLRMADDIDACLLQCVEQETHVGVSVCEAANNPYWMFYLDNRQQLQPLLPIPKIITRRQDLPKVYVLNGAVYVARRDWLEANKSFTTPQTHAYVMPRSRSVDIDDHLDLLVAEQLLSTNVMCMHDNKNIHE